MSTSPTYVLDANVFMEAARRYYAFDLAPTFWGQLVHHASNGRLLSIDRVRDEIELGKDELKGWASKDFHRWFAPTNEGDVIASYRDVMTWANAQAQFTDAAKPSSPVLPMVGSSLTREPEGVWSLRMNFPIQT